MPIKKEIIGRAEDLVVDLMYYDRKEDEVIRVGIIESAIKNREVTVNEICEAFRNKLLSWTESGRPSERV